MATIRIKRSTGSVGPETLANAELAYAEGSDRLYIGAGTGVTAVVRQIASGELFTAKTASLVYASPAATSGAPSFRALQQSDITGLTTALAGKASLSAANTFAEEQTFNAAVAFNNVAVSLGTSASAGTPATADSSTKVATTAFVKAQGYSTTVGTVTSVGLSLPNIFTVGQAVTTSGNITATLASQTGGLVFASPTGTSGAPTFRALVASDLPAATAYRNTANTFAAGTTQTFSGTVNLASVVQIGGVAMTSSAAELNLLDGSSVGAVANNKAVIYSAAGDVRGTTFSTSGWSLSAQSLTATGGLLVIDIAQRGLCNSVNGAEELSFAGEGEIAVTNDLSVGNDLDVSGNLVVGGTLTVNGGTTIVNSTQVTLDDPVLTLGGDTAPTVDTNTDRGIEFRWHNGTAAKMGFFGFDDSTNRFTFIPDNTSATPHVYSGTLGALDAGNYYKNGALLAASHLADGTTGSSAIVLSNSPAISSPALSGVPTSITAAVDTTSTQIATTAFVVNQASSTTPAMAGAPAVGTSKRFARADHVHPTDSSRAPLASPALTGTPTAPTAATATNSTQIATTAFVKAQGYALSSSLGTMASQNSNSVSITGGSISGATIDGGTW